MLGDVGCWEDRVRFIANHAAQVIRALLSETERYTTPISHVQVDVHAWVLLQKLPVIWYKGSHPDDCRLPKDSYDQNVSVQIASLCA